MKIFNKKLERLALRAITTGKPSALKLFANLSEDHFHDRGCLTVFGRIKRIAQKRSEILSWDGILEDGVIPEDIRLILKGFKDKPVVNTQRCQEMFDSLDAYRKTRLIYFGVKDLPEELDQAQALDVQKYIDQLAEVVSKAQSQADDDHFFIFGKDDNMDDVLERILSPNGITVLPTGLREFDNVNRGIKLGSVFFMGATTSGYKSLLSKCVLDNFVDAGAKCCFVSLEMDADEMFMRDLSRIARVSMEKLFDPDKLTDEERDLVRKAKKTRQKELTKLGRNIYLKVPKGNPSIEELLVQLKPHQFDVICIDYISLLRGVNEEEQWKKLGAITAFAKTFARNNKCIVMLLGQVSAEAKIRYSGGILENVDVAWIWVKDQTVIDTKILEIDCLKARQQKTMKFKVFAEPEFATITDIPKNYKPPQVQTLAKDAQKPAGSKKKNVEPTNDNNGLMTRYFGSDKKKAA